MKETFKDYGVRLPKIEISDEDYKDFGVDKSSSNRDFLKAVILKGLDDKISSGAIDKKDRKQYLLRVKSEIEVLEKGGFIDYILLVWDFINFCKKNNIPTGCGRGSAAGSMILYLIGVTNLVDPIKYKLYFERFVSEARIKKTVVDGIEYLDGGLLPDIDTDIAHEKRHLVISYLENKYRGKYCKLATFSKLASKVCVKDCIKIIMELPEEEAKGISDEVDSAFGKPDSIQETIEKSEKFSEFMEENPKVLKIASKLEGLFKSTSSHASGYLVSYYDLDECIPVKYTKNSDDEIELVSVYDAKDASDIAVKVDLLGLRDLTLVSNLVEKLGIDISKLDFDDKEVYAYLSTSDTPFGLFQIGASSVFSALRKIRPRNFEDLSALLAIARPGCLKFVDKYASFTSSGEAEKYDEHLDKIFGETANVPLYQEQLMRCVHEVFGLSLVEAEGVRKSVGKKDRDKMQEYKDKIYSQAEKLNLPKETADKFWQILLDSADYSFNRCLSPDTVVEVEDGFKCLFEVRKGDRVLAYDAKKGKDHFVEVLDVHENEVELFEVEFEDGKKIQCSMDHKFLTESGRMLKISNILVTNQSILCKGGKLNKVKEVKSIGVQKTLDLEVGHEDHNFYAEGLVTSNSHSVSYSVLAFLTSYLKYHYPKEFFLESLKASADKADSSDLIGTIQKEMYAHGIQLLPPDIFKSDLDFKIEGNNIRYGLRAVKGISSSTFDRIIALAGSKRGDKLKLYSVCKDLKIQISVLTALIQVGAFDSLGENRQILSYEARIFYLLTDKEREWIVSNSNLFNSNLFDFLKKATEWVNALTSKPVMRASRLETLKRNAEPAREMYKNHADQHKIAQYICEIYLLGYSHSYTLAEIVEGKTHKKLEKLINVNPRDMVENKTRYFSVVFVKKAEEKVAVSSGKPYWYMEIEDETCQRDVKSFATSYKTLINSNSLPKEGDIAILDLSAWNGMLTCGGAQVLETEVFIKPSDLTKSKKAKKEEK